MNAKKLNERLTAKLGGVCGGRRTNGRTSSDCDKVIR